MAKCRRPLPAEGQRILQAMTQDLRDRLHTFGWTHSALAERLRRDPELARDLLQATPGGTVEPDSFSPELLRVRGGGSRHMDSLP